MDTGKELPHGVELRVNLEATRHLPLARGGKRWLQLITVLERALLRLLKVLRRSFVDVGHAIFGSRGYRREQTDRDAAMRAKLSMQREETARGNHIFRRRSVGRPSGITGGRECGAVDWD